MPGDTKALPWVSKDGDPTWLGGDRWKIRVYAGLDSTGKQRQRSATFRAPNISEARTEARRRRVSIENQLKESAQWKGTVREIAEEWMEMHARKHAETTKYANGVMVKRIIRDIGRIRLEKLTALDLDRFYISLMDSGLSASTANHYHRIINGMLMQAFRYGKVPGNVAKLASPPKRTTNEDAQRMPTPEGLHALMAAAPHNVKIAAALAAATGCRRGEIVGLRWGDINGDLLTVRRALVEVPGQKLAEKPPKSGKPRTVTLDDDFLDVLTDHRMWLAGECAKAGGTLVPNGPILATLSPNTSGRIDKNGGWPYTPGWLTKQWVKLCDEYNVDFRFHSLRHFHATELLGRGIPITTVSSRLGHAQVSTTLNIYSHALPQGDRDAAKAIGDVMRKP